MPLTQELVCDSFFSSAFHVVFKVKSQGPIIEETPAYTVYHIKANYIKGGKTRFEKYHTESTDYACIHFLNSVTSYY